ncbi:hypothetical protein, partial [Microbulbifer thermotolerans]|uniref:hypothetical protein n=1 Tax=Microbulbifer thermotolerans TaxID=252514 RepID=UPI002249726A
SEACTGEESIALDWKDKELGTDWFSGAEPTERKLGKRYRRVMKKGDNYLEKHRDSRYVN